MKKVSTHQRSASEPRSRVSNHVRKREKVEPSEKEREKVTSFDLKTLETMVKATPTVVDRSRIQPE